MTYRARCEGRRRRNRARRSQFIELLVKGWAMLQQPTPLNYVLDPVTKESVPATSLEQWATFMENVAGRTVARTMVGSMEVSTVHLGVNYNRFRPEPVCFETMIFTEEGSGGHQQRYATWQEAELGHAEAVAWARARLS